MSSNSNELIEGAEQFGREIAQHAELALSQMNAPADHERIRAQAMRAMATKAAALKLDGMSEADVERWRKACAIEFALHVKSPVFG